MAMTEQELQSLRNMGNECEIAAGEIVDLRADLAAAKARPPVIWCRPGWRAHIEPEAFSLTKTKQHTIPLFDPIDANIVARLCDEAHAAIKGSEG